MPVWWWPAGAITYQPGSQALLGASCLVVARASARWWQRQQRRQQPAAPVAHQGEEVCGLGGGLAFGSTTSRKKVAFVSGAWRSRGGRRAGGRRRVVRQKKT